MTTNYNLTIEDLKVWFGAYSDTLNGKWFALSEMDTVEDFFREQGIEEYGIFDTDGQLDWVSQYSTPLDLEEEYIALERLTSEHRLDLEFLNEILSNEGMSPCELLKDIDYFTIYQGMTLKDVAYDIVGGMYDIRHNDDFLWRYFDYNSFTRDLSYDGYNEVKGGTYHRG